MQSRATNIWSKPGFLLGVVVCLLVGLTEVARTQHEFHVNVDCAVFHHPEDGPYAELYYGFDKRDLVTIRDERGRDFGEALVQLRVTREDEVFLSDIWRMEVEPFDSTEAHSKVVDMLRYSMEPGEYKLTFVVEDLNKRSRKDSVSMPLEVNAFQETRLLLSDIEFATSIRKASNGQDHFTKNTLEVLPNPGALYGDGLPMLFYYVEAYNLLSSIEGDRYETRCWITDTDGNEVEGVSEVRRTKTKRIDASVEVGAMRVADLPSGTYRFHFSIGPVNEDPLVTQSKRFYIYSESMMAARRVATDLASEMLSSEFGDMDEEELDKHFKIIGYIINEEARSLYSKLETMEAKRMFLYRFWKAQDPNPETKVNEFRQMYLERMEYANEEFRRMGKEGWKTDRGRVYMIYGPPDYVDRFPSTTKTYPYEIWYYDRIEGGVEFVFVDASGIREYVLVHSDATGEIKDPDWERNRAAIIR